LASRLLFSIPDSLNVIRRLLNGGLLKLNDNKPLPNDI